MQRERHFYSQTTGIFYRAESPGEIKVENEKSRGSGVLLLCMELQELFLKRVDSAKRECGL